MTVQKPDDLLQLCPFGEHLQKYWNRLSPDERRMQLDEQALYSLTPQSIAHEFAARLPGNSVIDALCGAGGDAIAFARAGKAVTAFELDSSRLEMARNNARLYNVSEAINFVRGDCSQLLPDANADAVYLDPPWGGPDYWMKGAFTLADFSPDAETLIRQGFKAASVLLLKIPKNFDLNEFSRIGVKASFQDHTINQKLFIRSALLSKPL